MKKTIAVFVFMCVVAAGLFAQKKGSNSWVGLWEGKDAKGDIYSLHFTDSKWEMYIESSGITLPLYRGTYTYTASRVTLKVTEEGDYNTMGWKTHKDNFPPITGRLSENALSVPTFTEAILVKE